MQKVKYDFASELTLILLHYSHTTRQAISWDGTPTTTPTHIKSCLRGQKPEKGFSNTTTNRKMKLSRSTMSLAGNSVVTTTLVQNKKKICTVGMLHTQNVNASPSHINS